MKSNSARHSIVVGTDSNVALFAGSVLVGKVSAAFGAFTHTVLDYDDYGDMLYRIDTFTVTGGTEVYIIETYVDERPTEQP